ncbi:ABC transporter ATP-binding protein [Bacillus sp. B15-48]|uniref:energy-coupling factor ABC transporter ATP-binding protein n=1 Tax=Bacillus sp. B15-48 TaxID=1548601 RepID=UPI00194001CB|nr:ABC transporter ATP-binding protein [Bacillus sp. B15-48]MBM4761242.1 ATP-binding cassette domain-containing protein [Bacillus sp. B15-48]
MSYLTLDNITFQYPNGFVAIEDVNMSFEKGESIAIIGQNGAGKTTTMKLLNGLYKPTKGNVIIDGWNTKDYTTAQISRKVGYVFQNPDEQIFHDEVYSEIEFGPKNLGLSPEQVKDNVEYAADLMGLKPYYKEHPYNLPFSIRKFVTIASIIAMDSSVIILDEPTAGQDAVSMDVLSAAIAKLNKDGKTVITISHDMEFVVRNFNRVIVMANKKKIADTDKREIFWNLPVLKEGRLKQPYISSLSNKLSLNSQILNVEEMVHYINKYD